MSFPHSDLLAAPFGLAERQLATELARHLKGDDDASIALVPFAGAWLLLRSRQGASCIELDKTPDWPAEWKARPAWPTRAAWEKLAAGSHPLIGGPADYRPLVVEHGRLYLHRYRAMEQKLAEGIRNLATVTEPTPAALTLLGKLFAGNAAMTPDFQRRAVYGALRRRFAVITGGPGTGKTTCVLNLLLTLLAENPRLAIALAAPTGKAAARMNDSLAAGMSRLRANPPAGLDLALLDKIPGDARTLHKLLGITPETPEGNPRASRHLSSADVVVVDEASMIALPLMTTLVRQLAPGARLILLGDRDQLASVDLGSVLGDIVAAAENVPLSAAFTAALASLETPIDPTEVRKEREGGEAQNLTTMTLSSAADLSPQDPSRSSRASVENHAPRIAVAPLEDAVHRLVHTYRFKRDEVVGRFCLALQDGRPAAAIAALQQFGSLAPAPESASALRDLVAHAVSEHYAALATTTDPVAALADLNRFRLLASHRVGPYGVLEINRLAALELGHSPGETFSGIPILITANTPDLDLWNGDCGILLRAPEGHLLAWFPGTPGQPPRAFSPAKLPDWEPAFAMSIHKSQGSEFDTVTLVLPPDDSPLLTRELLYTGASRAKHRLTVHATPALLTTSLARTVTRPSGLGKRLR